MTGRTADAPTTQPLAVPRIQALGIECPEFAGAASAENRRVRGLHLNESPFPPSPTTIAAIATASAGVHRYPDHGGAALRAALSERTGVAPDLIALGAGSNELIYASADITLDPGAEGISPTPGFPSYARAMAMRGARHVGVPVRADGVVDVPAILAAITPRTRLVFVASPHNPTGGLMRADEVEHLAQGVPPDVLLMFDEAYYEFGRAAGGPDVLAILSRRKGHWLVTRSFSKAYGIAGLRVGYGIAGSPAVADVFRKARPTFTLNSIGLAAAEAALGDVSYVDALLRHTGRERERLAGALAKHGFRALPAAANFVTLVGIRPAVEIAAALRAEGILVQPIPWPDASGALRITIGTVEDMDAVIAATARALAA